MGRLSIASALWIVAGNCALAQDPATYQPFLKRFLLDKAPVIVKARLGKDEVLQPLGIQVTRFEVLGVLRGPAMQSVLVGAMGERGSAWPDLDKLLFLKPLRSGVVHEAVDCVDLVAAEETAAPGLVADYLELENASDPVAALRRIRDLSLRGLDSGSVFAARVAIRELEGLVAAAPHLFLPADLLRLRRSEGRVPREDRERFRALVDGLGSRLAAHFSGCEAAVPEGPARDEFLRAVGRLRGTRDAAERVALAEAVVANFGRRSRLFCEALLLDASSDVRKRAAFFLGEFAEEGSFDPLARGFAEAGPEEKAERIGALGKIGRPEAVAVLREQLEHPDLLDAVLLALARIGTSDALEILDRLEARLKDVVGEESRVERIGWLRSKSFSRDEARRRLQGRQSYGP